MSQEKVHFRTGGKIEYCGVEILPDGKDIDPIVIDYIKFHPALKVQGSNKENMWTVHFAKNNPYTKLPMLLNSTNRKRLAKLAKNNYLEDIKNFPIRLTQELTKDISDGGSEIHGLRISKIPAKAVVAPAPKKDILTAAHPNFDACKAHLSGGGTIADLKAKYDIPKEVEVELLKK